MINYCLIIVGFGLIATGVIWHIDSHVVVKKQTKILTVYKDHNNAISSIYCPGEWDNSIEWIEKRTGGSR